MGETYFLWAKSILPPTGVVDAVAAGIAVSLTASMLVTINYILKNDSNLTDKVETKINYKKFSAELSGKVKNASLGDWINPSYWASMISKLV